MVEKIANGAMRLDMIETARIQLDFLTKEMPPGIFQKAVNKVKLFTFPIEPRNGDDRNVLSS